MTRDHPLTGVGVGMFGHGSGITAIPPLHRIIGSAHNLYLHDAELGFPGIVVGIWLLAAFL
jgi:hypothetical protein